MQYLLLDGSNFDTNFLIEVFKNEYDYPYLKKIYDSKELGYNHHVKVFEIDIEYYANLKKQQWNYFKLDLNLRPQNLDPLTYFKLTKEWEKLSN